MVNLKELKDLKEHRLTIRNRADVDILYLDVEFYSAEPVVGFGCCERPPGIHVEHRAQRPQMVVSGTGTVSGNRPPLPPKTFQIMFDRLPAQKHVEFAVFTSTKIHEAHDLNDEVGPFAEIHKAGLLHYLLGTFQFQYRGATLTKKVVAPIVFDKAARCMSVHEVREDFGSWRPVKMEIFS